ncbi:MAG: restriction endonuclease [Pseudanabaena sp. ELA607]|jgi:restriction system protein
MLYRNTKLLLGLIPIFISFLIAQGTLARPNISPETTRIELTARLDRCKDQGFKVGNQPANEAMLNKSVETCEAKLGIRYPAREELLNRVEVCIQNGYKDKIPTTLTWVALNDLVHSCESMSRASGWNNSFIFVLFVIIYIFAAILIITLHQSSSGDNLASEKYTDELLLKQHQLLNEVDQMSGREFEEFLAQLYQGIGWNVELTGKSNDGGCDLIISTQDRSQLIAIQAKRSKNKIGYKAVQEVYTARGIYQTKEAWVVTNSYFTAPTQARAKQLGVKLYDRNNLQQLIFEYVNRLNP